MRLRLALRLFCFGSVLASIDAPSLELPPRLPTAESGTAFARRIASLALPERERAILSEVRAGNVPESWRHFAPVTVERLIDGQKYTAEISVSPDYLTVGAENDSLITPLTPGAAQEIADELGCLLPTPQMVNAIHEAAVLKLAPSPIPPSAAMVKVETWLEHRELIRNQREGTASSGGLVSGHKKDVVVSTRLASAPGKVAIYGWHRADGTPIQSLYVGHTETWVDYSHGIRLVARAMKLNGESTTVDAVLADPRLSALLSDEGAVTAPRYSSPPTNTPDSHATLSFEAGVRVVIDAPVHLDPQKPVRLILFALPSGNTIEQTIGRRTVPGDDWHFEIQHIGAQTRWLRERVNDASLVVAYLECEGKSWPAWRKKHDPKDERVRGIVDALRERFAQQKVSIVLTGHSGGGSFTFGYLNGVPQIPADIERIAFLDSNYAYDSAKGHGSKLAAWLAASNTNHLNVIAYEDYIALLDGKTFVSEQGGTWGRSRAMLADLSNQLAFTSETDAEWERHTALEGRVKFLMRKNPEKAVLHTRLVEFNGFIHAMLTGTALESKDYVFFGPRAYESHIGAR